MAHYLYVKGYKPDTKLEQLVIYFQSKESGGGDIDDEQCKFKEDFAIIAFDEKEDFDRVRGKIHSLKNGSELTISPEPFKTPSPKPLKTTPPTPKPRNINPPQKQRNNSDKNPPQLPAIDKPIIDEIRTVIVSGIGPETTDSTLQFFFENERRSGGGDIEDFKRIEPQIAHITFLSSQVASSVLKKQHLEVDGYLLKLEAKKPKVTFPTDKKKLYVENLSTKTSKDSLLNYVEVITGLEVADVVFGKNNNATVTLKNEEPDMNKTKEKAKKKPLEGAALKITNPPVCNSILVTGISEETTKDSIEFKFENPKYGGGEILDVAYQQDKGKAVISYYDPDVINRMVSIEHMLNDSKLTVCRHYPFMEGHDEHVVESKKKVITVKPDVMDHVSNRCHNEFSQSFGFPISQTKYDEDKEELTFIILPTGKPSENQIKEIENYFNKFVVKEIQVSRNLLTNSKNEIEDLLSKTMESFNNKVHAAIDKEKLCILLTGKEDKLGKVTKAFQKELDELHKKKEEATQNLSLDPEKLMFIWSLGFEEKFESESNIEVKIDAQNGILILKGNKELVDSAKMEAYEMLSKVKEETIELNERKEEFLASGGLEKINEGLRKRKMKALVCLDKSKPKRAKVELLNSQKFNEVDQYLSEQLSEKSLTIEKESVSLLKDEKWTNFRDDLTEKFEINVFTIENVEVEVWLTGENNQVQKAYKELKEFVKFNTIISESIVLHRIGRYLEKFGDRKIKEIEQRLKKDFVQLEKGKKEGTLFLQGTKEGVTEAKIMLQEIIIDVAHRFIPVEEPGMQKYLHAESGKISLEGLESKHRCTITLTNNNTKQREIEISPVVQPDTATASSPSSTLLCSFETPEKMMLHVYQADITNYQCDVIVNAANGDLQHIGGLAKMIADKGGKEIQEDCNEYVKKHGRLHPGECYSGIPGKLQCKRIIHAVGPRWDNVNRVKHKLLLLTACEDSLKHAKTYSTVALPAVGSGIYGVPKDVCASLMVEAAENFSSESRGQCALQEIHFVNNDLTTAQCFVKEFKKRFSGKRTFLDKSTRANRSRFNEGPNTRRRRQDEFEDRTNVKASMSQPTSQPSADNITTNTNTLISVVVGDLSTHQADVLVNTTSENLQLNNNPCSKALSNEAGPVLQQKCNAIGKLRVGEVAFTEGGSLLCKQVCHVVCTQYNNGQGEKVLRTIIKNSLKQSDSLGHVSIAFPAIGTGVLAFPHQLTAKICFEEAKEFGKKNPNSSVKDIRFVVYHQDQSSINAFKEELRKQAEWKKEVSQGTSRRDKRKPVGESTQASSSTERRSSTEETSTDEIPPEMPSSMRGPIMTEKRDGEISISVQNGVTIQVLKGDITKETTDVIAHLSNQDMSMAGGVAKAIIKSGGEEIERETRAEKKPIRMHNVLLTKAGRLRAKYIAHMAAPDGPDPTDIGKCITNCLKEITKRECKTISMPAIATGQLNMPADKSAKAMLTVIVAFLQTRPGSLNTVRIVIHDPELFKKFSKAVKKLLQEEEESPGFFSALISSFLGWFKSDSASSNIKQESAPAKSMLFLEIYADKDETINKVAKQVEKITSDQIRRERIEEDEIENLSEANISRINRIGEENNVEVKIEKSIKRIIVRGHFEDIGKVMMEIRSILNEIKLAEQEKETAEMVAKGVQWYWIDADDSQAEYDVSLNSKIEKAFIKEKKSVTFELEEGKCEIVFDKMQETNKKTGQKTEVVRKDLKAKAYISVPDYWDPHPTDSKGKECPVHVVSLDPQNNANHSKEYKNISDGFLQTAPNQTIQKIERIQNPSLFKLYALKKQSMDERDGSNEKFLYHGTSTAKVADINKNGLNRSYNGAAHGTAFGKGIYFARDAGMSAGYAKPDAPGADRSMYVARVSVGQYILGNSAMIVPPDSYDSVVNNTTAPTIFVSFYDNQYYPEYLITFR